MATVVLRWGGLSKETEVERGQKGQTRFSRKRRWEGCSRERSEHMQTQGLEEFSRTDSQSLRDKVRAKGRARPGREAGLKKALGPLAFILGGLGSAQDTDTEFSEGEFLNLVPDSFSL